MTVAIQMMRRIESAPTDSGRRRSRVIEECRELLGAVSMSFCHLLQNGELVYVNLAGSPPDEAAVNEIMTRLSRRKRSWFSGVTRIGEVEIVIAGRGSDAVCAVVSPPTEPWTEDFVAFVAERFIHRIVRDSAAPERLRAHENLILPDDMVIGPSVAMRDLLAQMAATVRSGLDALVTGETGTGKEFLARLIHASGPTRDGPFVAINCAAIPGELLEAELFGVERRVATGVDPRRGLFVEADGGSLLLDEIGELPMGLQPKLLRVLQEREVLALGASRPKKISVRIISASNRDLAEFVSQGRFRADLYYRLHALEFRAPALRDRPEDIPALATEFMVRASEQYGRSIVGISHAAITALQSFDWPGNIRQLQSAVRRAVLLCADGDSIGIEHFASVIAQTRVAETRPITVSLPPSQAAMPRDPKLHARVDAAEREAIEEALLTTGGNRSRAARLLGITRNGLAQKMRRLGIATGAKVASASRVRRPPLKEPENAQ